MTALQADELCPPDSDIPIPTPFFIRSPNHREQNGEYQACFVLNPDCRRRSFKLLEWIGKVMGAAIRSEESITLAMPPLFWKRLSGEKVTWEGDYANVDVSVVYLLDTLAHASAEDFDGEDAIYSSLTLSTTLSTGRVVEMGDNGADKQLSFAHRDRYAPFLLYRHLFF